MLVWYGHRKKKVLINLPFKVKEKTPSQAAQVGSQPPAPSPTKEDIKQPQQATPKEINKPKPAASLKGGTNLSFSGSISIKKAEKEKVIIDDSSLDLSPKPAEEFTTEAFFEKWSYYKKLLLKDGKSSLASIFEELPHINNNEITITLENKALDDEFNAQKSDVLDFIRKELNNYDIAITTVINKDSSVKRAYTPQEKFAKMSDKNPNLIGLAKAFEVEVGYPID